MQRSPRQSFWRTVAIIELNDNIGQSYIWAMAFHDRSFQWHILNRPLSTTTDRAKDTDEHAPWRDDTDRRRCSNGDLVLSQPVNCARAHDASMLAMAVHYRSAVQKMTYDDRCRWQMNIFSKGTAPATTVLEKMAADRDSRAAEFKQTSRSLTGTTWLGQILTWWEQRDEFRLFARCPWRVRSKNIHGVYVAWLLHKQAAVGHLSFFVRKALRRCWAATATPSERSWADIALTITMSGHYLELSTNPLRFEAIGKATNVFFDEANRQVSIQWSLAVT